MRPTVPLLLIALSIPYASAQDASSESDSTTEIGALLLTQGVLVRKELIQVGEVADGLDKVTLNVIVAQARDVRKAGLQVEVSAVELGGPTRRTTVFVDQKDLADLVDAVQEIVRIADRWIDSPPPAYYEVLYHTPGRLLVGAAYKDKRQQRAVIAAGGETDVATVSLRLASLRRISEVLHIANEQIIKR